MGTFTERQSIMIGFRKLILAPKFKRNAPSLPPQRQPQSTPTTNNLTNSNQKPPSSEPYTFSEDEKPKIHSSAIALNKGH